MLLVIQRVVVVYQADGAVELNARREIFQQAVVSAIAIAELEALMVAGAVKHLLKDRIQDQGEASEVPFNDRLQFEFQVRIVELRRLVPFQFDVPSEIDRQHALVEKPPAQSKLVARPPEAMPARLRKGDVACRFDTIGEAICE